MLSSQWMSRFKDLKDLCQSVSLMCSINSEEYHNYKMRRVDKIANASLSKALILHSHSFGSALEFIEDGIHKHNTLFCVPQTCHVQEPHFGSFKPIWNKHVLSERQSLKELKQAIDLLFASIDKAMKNMQGECEVVYSSYSDYSDSETTDSDDEGEEDGDEDDENESGEYTSGRDGKGENNLKRERERSGKKAMGNAGNTANNVARR